MAEITAAQVKELRDETALGMMDCKKAWEDSGGDIGAARDLLRKKGLTTAEKKASRATKEGLVAIFGKDVTAAVMVEIQCETDFCSRNEECRNMAADIAEMAYSSGDGPVELTTEMTECQRETLAKTGDNMTYARGVKISAGKIGKYIHHNGKVGVLLGIDGQISDELLSDLCMHIAFANPMGISPDDVPADLVEKEKEIARQQAIDSGKPAEIAEKMVAGKIRKFLAERALLEQQFVKDDKKKVREILGGATVTSFARFAVGGSG